MKAKLLVSTAFLAASVSLSAQKSATITVHADQGKEINDTEYDGEVHSLEIIIFHPNTEKTGLERAGTRSCTPQQLAKLLTTGH